MTAKELLLKEASHWSEHDAEVALRAVEYEHEAGSEPDVVGLPDGWGETLTGEPMPNVVAAVRRVRAQH